MKNRWFVSIHPHEDFKTCVYYVTGHEQPGFRYIPPITGYRFIIDDHLLLRVEKIEELGLKIDELVSSIYISEESEKYEMLERFLTKHLLENV